MNTIRLIVEVKIGNVRQSEIWDDGRKIKLGMSLPWSLIRTEDGFRLRHKEGQAWDISTEALDEEIPIELPALSSENSGKKIFLKLRRVNAPQPVYTSGATSLASLGAKSRKADYWTAYDCSGDGVYSSERFDKHFLAAIDDRKLFSITRKGANFEVKKFDSAVRLEGINAPDVGGQDSSHVLTAQQLAQVSIVWKKRVWRFSPISERNIGVLPMLPRAIDGELRFFRRVSTLAASLLVVLLAGTLVMEDREDDDKEEKEKQFAKIVFTKPVEKPAGPKSAPAAPQPPIQQAEAEKKAPETIVDPAPVVQAKKTTPIPEKSISIPAKNAKKGDGRAPKIAVRTEKKVKKKRTSQAVARAQSLQKQMSALAGGMTSLLAKSKIAKGNTRRAKGGEVFGGQALGSSGAAPKVDALGKQNVRVGYTSGGTGDGRGNGKLASYKYSGKHDGKALQGSGDKFLRVEHASGGAGATVGDGLTKGEVWDVINRHLSEIRYCYEAAILKRPDVEGKLVVGFTISKKGRVKGTSVKTSTLADRKLDQCVLKRIAKWKFPRPKGNLEVGISYPFVFRRL